MEYEHFRLICRFSVNIYAELCSLLYPWHPLEPHLVLQVSLSWYPAEV